MPCCKLFNAWFQIPQLRVDHTIECVLRNLIAFEQCHYLKEPYICNYVSLIDSPIHTKDDTWFLFLSSTPSHLLFLALPHNLLHLCCSNHVNSGNNNQCNSNWLIGKLHFFSLWIWDSRIMISCFWIE